MRETTTWGLMAAGVLVLAVGVLPGLDDQPSFGLFLMMAGVLGLAIATSAAWLWPALGKVSTCDIVIVIYGASTWSALGGLGLIVVAAV